METTTSNKFSFKYEKIKKFLTETQKKVDITLKKVDITLIFKKVVSILPNVSKINE